MADVGNVEFPDSDILPFRTIECPNAPGTALAGEIVKSGPFFGLLQDNCSHEDLRGLVIRSHIRIKKTAAAIADNAPITLTANADGAKNDYWAVAAIGGGAIHGYAMETAPLNTTDILVRLVEPPFATV